MPNNSKNLTPQTSIQSTPHWFNKKKPMALCLRGFQLAYLDKKEWGTGFKGIKIALHKKV